MKGTSYLVGSGEEGLLTQVARRARQGIGKANVRVAVSYAPVAGDARGLEFMSQRMARLFPGAVLSRFAVAGEEGAPPPDVARAIVERADLLFVSGGDAS